MERDSQTRIVIGSDDQRIKTIGTWARKRIETLDGNAVYLDLRAKVLPYWRRNPAALARFGYSLPPDEKK